MTAAGSPTDPLSFAVFCNSAVDIIQVHNETVLTFSKNLSWMDAKAGAVNGRRKHSVGLNLAGHQLLGLQTAERGDLLAGSQLRQRVDGCFDERDGIIGAVGLRQNIMNAGCLANRTHRLAGDDTGTGTGRDQQHFGGTVASPNLVRNRAFDQRNIDHASRGLFLGFLDTGGHFVCLAIAPAATTLAVTDHDHRRETETPPAFDNRRATFDLDDTIQQTFAWSLVLRLMLSFSASAAGT